MYIAQTNSTNNYLKLHPELDAVYAGFQTAGRGQVGNAWESEANKNVLLSLRLRPSALLAANQWQVCMQVSVALWRVVAEYIHDTSRLTIKWPNDLYYDDHKLAGVLIEHTLKGNYIAESVVGIGLNVNQTQWSDSVPNPTSLYCITHQENSIDQVAEQLIRNVQNLPLSSMDCTKEYQQYLYRQHGFYWWEEREVSALPTMNGTKTDRSFQAQIKAITPQGEIVLQNKKGEEKIYHFKQVKYIL